MYFNFKSLLETERYLSLDLLSKQRYSLWDFRCTSHTLHIVGRHTGAETSQRICSHCLLYNNLRVVDCEYHAFFHCTKYSDNRETYLFSWYVRSWDPVSFYSLMSSRQDDIIKNIALYLSKLVDRFKQWHKYSLVMTQLIL